MFGRIPDRNQKEPQGGRPDGLDLGARVPRTDQWPTIGGGVGHTKGGRPKRLLLLAHRVSHTKAVQRTWWRGNLRGLALPGLGLECAFGGESREHMIRVGPTYPRT